MQWETVIGLEVHVQLATQSKIFSGASTAFGQSPNTQANAVDLALPGTLPVVNEQAVDYAIRFGLAIGSDICRETVFERKNYFYPDLPKNYQTSQMDAPIVEAGHLDIQLANGEEKRIRIHHAHLEEDAGKSLHEDFHGQTGIDLNRAGTPLLEIVTEPDIRSIEEAVAFAKKLHSLVTSIEVSDGEMSQGSMRFDVNISVRPMGQEEFGTRTETKNLNSFKFMEDCIALEVERQIEVLESGGSITQETRLYNGQTKVAKSMRTKEEANDYRYFPCPDLLPIEITDERIERVRGELPELPEAKCARFIEAFGLSDYDANLLTQDSTTAKFFEKTTGLCSDAKLVANWLLGDVAAMLNAQELTLSESKLTPELLAGLISRIKDKTISSKIAKTVFEKMMTEGLDADAIIEKEGLKQESDEGAIEKMVDEVLAANPEQVANYKAAPPEKRKKMSGFFVGQIMKASKGKANPGVVNQLLAKKLSD
ncbi:MAG: Asp-tRNA(Asn)/Glu-tRNA(Gln) amidotransferase subunit GatB [Cellvibrionales bacterium]|nr:Asp-tRNA(Asn)/Glu-tRNA(Gln) amidotransferase subunit GatB [Cellvibrionales bacterium]